MSWLTLQLLLNGGRVRAWIVLGCAAVATALLLVALTMVLLPDLAEEALWAVVAEPGTRGGAVLAVLLLVLLPGLLLRQSLRFGTAAREQRLAGLRLAGATPADVRRLSALEVGLPALAGGVLGVLVFGVLRTVVGGDPGAYSAAQASTMLDDCRQQGLTAPGECQLGPVLGSVGQVVPQSVSPTWWMLVLVVLAVAAAGAAVGARTGTRLSLSPYGVARRRGRRAPRAGGPVVVAVVSWLLLLVGGAWFGALALLAAVAVAVLLALALAPWLAHRVGLRVLDRTTRPEAMLAAARLVADPRPAGRAAAGAGGIGLVAGPMAVVALELGRSQQLEAFYLLALALVALCLLVGLVVTCGTVAIHAAESLGDRRRSVAALVAQGVPTQVLERSLRWEAGLVAVPLGVGGAVLGAAATVLVGGWETARQAVLVPLSAAVVAAVVVGLLTLLAVTLTARLLRPAVRAAARAEHLRTA